MRGARVRGGFDETSSCAAGGALDRPEAASSVAPVTINTRAPCVWPRDDHPVPAASDVPPNPPSRLEDRALEGDGHDHPGHPANRAKADGECRQPALETSDRGCDQRDDDGARDHAAGVVDDAGCRDEDRGGGHETGDVLRRRNIVGRAAFVDAQADLATRSRARTGTGRLAGVPCGPGRRPGMGVAGCRRLPGPPTPPPPPLVSAQPGAEPPAGVGGSLTAHQIT
jgi:hypothetical protein